jgi:hypothetical protein
VRGFCHWEADRNFSQKRRLKQSVSTGHTSHLFLPMAVCMPGFGYALGMHSCCILLLLALGSAATARADLYERIRTTLDGHTAILARYTQGSRVRLEVAGEGRARKLIIIENPERNQKLVLDPASQTYIELRLQESGWIDSFAQWVSHRGTSNDSGKRVDVYYERIDTGERKDFLGRTAQHIYLREHHVAEPGACDHTHDVEKEGWYVPIKDYTIVSNQSGLVRPNAFLLQRSCRDRVVIHGDVSPPGLAMIERSRSVEREVLELSDAPLRSRLFEVPPAFRRVDTLLGYQSVSWSERMSMAWSQLEQAFISWF